MLASDDACRPKENATAAGLEPPARIVFIHLGRRLPGHLPVALGQAVLFSGGPVTLVAERRALRRTRLPAGVEPVSCERLGLSPRHRRFRRESRLDRSFREGFVAHATERFFYLESLMRASRPGDVLHLESDVMLYAGVESLQPVLRAAFPHVAATFSAPSHCIPGVVYVRRADAMAPLLETLLALAADDSRVWNDMWMLAEYRRLHPDLIGRLPIVTPDYPGELRSLVDPAAQPLADYSALAEEFGGVFDAAALGQYLGGVDPRNSRGADTRGFVNEHHVFDPSRYGHGWETDAAGRRVPYIATGRRRWRTLTLHVHSKDLVRFAS